MGGWGDSALQSTPYLRLINNKATEEQENDWKNRVLRWPNLLEPMAHPSPFIAFFVT
jgi:hypothetical protein